MFGREIFVLAFKRFATDPEGKNVSKWIYRHRTSPTRIIYHLRVRENSSSDTFHREIRKESSKKVYDTRIVPSISIEGDSFTQV